MPLFTVDFDDDDPLFSVNFHPEKPEFVVGLATGRVTYYEYAAGAPTEVWSTKRHKGSCRALAYTQTGEHIVSVGADGVVKKFAARTGKVTAKASVAAGGAALCVNEDYVVVGDDDGNVHALKLADLKLHRRYDLADTDAVTAVCALPVNRHNFAVAADMRLVRIDVRKDEPVSFSEDQEDEILCGCVPSEGRSAWGMSEGVVTVWNNRGLGDQQRRVRLTADGSVDAILAGELDDRALAGTSEGIVYEIDVNAGKVLHRAPHSARDDVSYLDYDYEYRLVSGSMSLLKVWTANELEEVEAELAELARQQPPNKKAKKDKAKKAKAATPKPSPFADLMD